MSGVGGRTARGGVCRDCSHGHIGHTPYVQTFGATQDMTAYPEFSRTHGRWVVATLDGEQPVT